VKFVALVSREIAQCPWLGYQLIYIVQSLFIPVTLMCLQVANMLGAMLSKEEVDEFMREADIVSLYFNLKI
jgi:hypothetical protein